MSDTTFTNGSTVIQDTWAQDVNNAVYRAIGTGINGTSPTSPVDVRNNINVSSKAELAASGGAALIGVNPTGTLTATNVQAALVQLASTSLTPPIQIVDNPASLTNSTLRIDRLASAAGGTPGYVNSAVFAKTYVTSATREDFEWAITGSIDNGSNLGQNVGVYGQGNKQAQGPTWGMVAEVCDTTNANTTGGSGGSVGLEVDVWCNGTDANAKRIGVDVTVGNAQYVRNGVNGIGPGQGYSGVRITPMNGAEGPTTGSWQYGVEIVSATAAGIYNRASGTWGIFHSGTYQVGIDISTATHSTNTALRIKSDDYISLVATDQFKFKYNNSTGYLEFYNGATRKGYLDFGAGGSDVKINASGGGGGSTFSTITVTDPAGGRIVGDFSNATLSNRTLFQTTTVNSFTGVGVVPNGSGVGSYLQVYTSSVPANTTIGSFSSDAGKVAITVDKTGTGTYLPLDLQNGGFTNCLRVATNGHVYINKTSDDSSGAVLQVSGALSLTTALAVAYGGTGATTAAGAITNLGAVDTSTNQSISGIKTFGSSVVFNGDTQFNGTSNGFVTGLSISANQTVNWASTGNITSSATAGGASALPATPSSYLRVKVDGVAYKIPLYN